MKPRILITIGDINGIGPETILKTLMRSDVKSKYDLTILSPHSVLAYYNKLLRLKVELDRINILFTGEENVKIQPGKISAVSGITAGMAIETAIELCLNKQYDAIVTAPISKKALNLGGYHYDGHTEMLTALGKSKNTAMIMVSKKLLMGFATTHPPLKNVSKIITQKLIVQKVGVCYNSLVNDFGIKKPDIGMLSLNPHAGESGQIGIEEINIIRPAIKTSLKKYKGLSISGPYPSDGYFGNKTYGKHDLTFALYHDQGFIPFKMIAGLRGVNFTAGLSFVRTSPDHGTAFDIAGKGNANEVSLIETIKVADKIVRIRKRRGNV